MWECSYYLVWWDDDTGWISCAQWNACFSMGSNCQWPHLPDQAQNTSPVLPCTKAIRSTRLLSPLSILMEMTLVWTLGWRVHPGRRKATSSSSSFSTGSCLPQWLVLNYPMLRAGGLWPLEATQCIWMTWGDANGEWKRKPVSFPPTGSWGWSFMNHEYHFRRGSEVRHPLPCKWRHQCF